MSDWLEQLFGFAEESPGQVRSKLSLKGDRILSQVNGQSYGCGSLETPSLAELRERVESEGIKSGRLQLSEVVGNAQHLHQRPENACATFQVASQFNLLEMVSPDVTPDEGVGIYERDFTQGPACAIACGAGTVFRNYFIEIHGQLGQTADRQIDCLADMGNALGNEGEKLWRMRNGYALPSREGLEAVAATLSAMSESELDAIRAKLRVGVHSGVQVTLDGCEHAVTQVYGSALPVAYSSLASALWESFAQLILYAAYEVTFCAAAANAARTGNNRLFLTLLGGGAFGNEESWIISAIRRSIDKFRHVDLDVRVVSFRNSNPIVQTLIESIK
ncbi:MAG: hypothetical protein NXI32_13080 [bacterium]|nr:hypothetical protein [bacterium]